jgi:hypothetical protein
MVLTDQVTLCFTVDEASRFISRRQLCRFTPPRRHHRCVSSHARWPWHLPNTGTLVTATALWWCGGAVFDTVTGTLTTRYGTGDLPGYGILRWSPLVARMANHTTAELALLLGASGDRADARIAKTRRDLNGLLYADGLHGSFYLAAGKGHVAVDPARARIEAVRRLDAPAHTSRHCSGEQPPTRRRDDQPATTSPSRGRQRV